MDSAIPTYSGVRYSISDPVDVEPISMWTALMRMAEANIARNLRSKDYRERELEAVRALRQALENDMRYTSNTATASAAFTPTITTTAEVLVDMDPPAMVAALRVPRAKLEKRQLDSAAQRVVTLRELLGPATPGLPAIQRALLGAFAERFEVEWSEEALTPEEEALAWRHHREEIGTEAFVAGIDDPAHERDFAAGTHTGPGGTITAYLRLECPARGRIGQVLITGDFFIAPPRIVLDLEAALPGAYLSDAAGIIERFFDERTIAALSVGPAEFRAALELALISAPETLSFPALRIPEDEA